MPKSKSPAVLHADAVKERDRLKGALDKTQESLAGLKEKRSTIQAKIDGLTSDEASQQAALSEAQSLVDALSRFGAQPSQSVGTPDPALAQTVNV